MAKRKKKKQEDKLHCPSCGVELPEDYKKEADPFKELSLELDELNLKDFDFEELKLEGFDFEELNLDSIPDLYHCSDCPKKK